MKRMLKSVLCALLASTVLLAATTDVRAQGVLERAKRDGEAKIHVALLGRAIPVATSPGGWRALAKDKPIDPASVARYLESKFGAALGECRAAMTALARAFAPDDLAQRAYQLYVAFRPAIPEGESGWGAKGTLDLATIERLARSGGGNL